MMNFENMLIMIGPSGVECDHSVYDEKGRAINNHWVKGSDGNIYARNAEYIYDFHPKVDTIENGQIKNVDLESLRSLTFELASEGELIKEFEG